MNANKRILEELWICPPLAFARFGQAKTPLVNFHWAESDYAARSTAETVIKPALTFEVADDGTLTDYMPEEIVFRVEGKWRPLCPFFEVHGRWTGQAEGGPLTEADLESAGISLSDIVWEVETANRKAYHYTSAEGDHVSAKVKLNGNHHEPMELRGLSPTGGHDLLVPEGTHLPMGKVQVIRPNERFPELRIRITPPGGRIYAPTNTRTRDLSALLPANQDRAAFLANIHCILNPDSPWTKWTPGDDPRTNPGGLYAQEPTGMSLGFLDDSSDGRIKVTIKGDAVASTARTAEARFTCCPPDFQPDRRPFVSVADGLKDAVDRSEVLEKSFVEDNWPETEREIADFMQRVRETMESSNLDHQNLRSQLGNDGIVGPDLGQMPFDPEVPRPGHPFPLLEAGRANHARFLAYEVFKQRLGQRPELFEKWIREPTAERTVYDKQMPALMRGSDSYPMTLSQRQYDLMAAWLKYVETEGTGQ